MLVGKFCIAGDVPADEPNGKVNGRGKRERLPAGNRDAIVPTANRRYQTRADFGTPCIAVSASQLDAAFAEPAKAGWWHLDFLHRLLDSQAGQRAYRAQ